MASGYQGGYSCGFEAGGGMCPFICPGFVEFWVSSGDSAELLCSDGGKAELHLGLVTPRLLYWCNATASHRIVA